MSVLGSIRTLHNVAELRTFWEELLPEFKKRCVLLLSGDVGAGKTTSVQIIADILGFKDVQSPSFAIHLRYQAADGRGMDHIDLYRLKDDDDLESSGFWDIFDQDEGLVIIEWADRLNYDYLPLHWQKVEVKFTKLADTLREVSAKTL